MQNEHLRKLCIHSCVPVCLYFFRLPSVLHPFTRGPLFFCYFYGVPCSKLATAIPPPLHCHRYDLLFFFHFVVVAVWLNKHLRPFEKGTPTDVRFFHSYVCGDAQLNQLHCDFSRFAFVVTVLFCLPFGVDVIIIVSVLLE